MTSLLAIFTGLNALRSLVTCTVAHADIVAPSPAVIALGADLCKFSVASIMAVFLSRNGGRITLRGDVYAQAAGVQLSASKVLKPYFGVMVSSTLSVATNVLFLIALKMTSPTIILTVVLSKIPLIAVLHHFFVTPNYNIRVWTSIVCLLLGLVLAASPEELWHSAARRNFKLLDLLLAPILGLLVGVISASSTVSMEIALKTKAPFWSLQLWLHLFSSICDLFATLAFKLMGPDFSRSLNQAISAGHANLTQLSLIIVLSAAAGLAEVALLRHGDSSVKLVGDAFCIATVEFVQQLINPSAGSWGSKFRSLLGTGILALSTWTYNHYKDMDSRHSDGQKNDLLGFDRAEQIPLDLSSASGGNDSEDIDLPEMSKYFLSPLQRDGPTGAIRPTPYCLALALAAMVFSSLLAALILHPPQSIARDQRIFFEVHNIRPADWQNISPAQRNCVMEAFNYHPDIDPDSFLLANWETGIITSNCSVFPVPDEGFMFHLYWKGPWQSKNHALTTDSFLATQRLSDGHRLVFWYEDSEPDISYLERYTSFESSFRRFVEVRKFDPAHEAAGTCLQSMREYLDEDYRISVGMEVQAYSDLVRLLLLAKYGGVWLDADTILMRDFTPLIRSGPMVPTYQNISETEPSLTNNNVLIYGPAWSGVGQRVLSLACTMPYDMGLFAQAYPQIEARWWPSWHYNSGVHQMCQYKNCGVGKLPIQWIDGMSWTEAAIAPCERGLQAGSQIPSQLHGIFAWHARMLHEWGQDEECWRMGSGSAVTIVIKAIHSRLEQFQARGSQGADLFPGPGYVGI